MPAVLFFFFFGDILREATTEPVSESLLSDRGSGTQRFWFSGSHEASFCTAFPETDDVSSYFAGGQSTTTTPGEWLYPSPACFLSGIQRSCF